MSSVIENVEIQHTSIFFLGHNFSLTKSCLDLSVSAGALAEPPPTDGVDLVHEDDARLVVSGIVEHLPDQPRRLSNVLVHNRTGDNFEEVGVKLACNRPCQQGLSCSRWTIQQAA